MDETTDTNQEELLGAARVVPVRSGQSQTVHRNHRVPSWPQKAGLGFGCAAAAVVTVLMWSGMLNPFLPWNQYSPSVGEQLAIELADGSILALDTQSNVRVDLSDDARDIYLDDGQALFAMAQDAARPFRVHVGSALVQAVGTKFDIRRMRDRTDVAVIEGRVWIDAGSSETRLAAGEAANINADRQITAPAAIAVADIGMWQKRRLVFRSSTLAEIAAEFCRYNRTPKIRIEGDELRGRRFSAVLDADDPESFLVYLASDDSIAVERRGNEVVVRLRQSE